MRNVRKIRIDNTFAFTWKIKRGGEIEELGDVHDMKLVRYIGKIGRDPMEVPVSLVDSNTVRVDVPTGVANRLGDYIFELSYLRPDATLTTLERECTIDVTAFTIVARTAYADPDGEFSLTSDLLIGLVGPKFESKDFTAEEWVEIQRPALEAAATVDDSKTAANNAAQNANAKAEAANIATGKANTAALNADAKATDAQTAKEESVIATTAANTAAQLANDKASAADVATGKANTATGKANTAASNANSKATAAQTAKESADGATIAANAAAQLANDKAFLASEATRGAVDATQPAIDAAVEANTQANYAKTQGDRVATYELMTSVVASEIEYNEITF